MTLGFRINRKNHKPAFFLLFPILGFIAACNTTKYVSEHNYLLDKYEIRGELKHNIKKDGLENYVRQKPNKKILGFKFHLGLYNLSKKDKENWINRSLRTIGEEPVIYDEGVTERTVEQLELFLKNKGYYHAEVNDSVLFKKQKATVVYFVDPNEPYRIGKINYQIEDTTLTDMVLGDTLSSVLETGGIFDVDILSKERDRIENYLKQRGYFYFSREFIYFEADTSSTKRTVDLTMVLMKFRELREDGTFREVSHPVAQITDVLIHTNYKPRLALSNREAYNETLDTLFFEGMEILYSYNENVNPGVIVGSSYLSPGNIYDIEDVRRTHRNLSNLRLFRLVNIEFSERKDDTLSSQRELVCEIMLTPHTLQSFTVEVQGTNSSGNIGAAGNLIYQHRNLLKGAENMELRLRGAIETLRDTTYRNFDNMVEFGAEISMDIPKFLLPFRTEQFIKRFNPSTEVSLAYNYQRRPDFTRTYVTSSFGYRWRGNRFVTHQVNPVELNFVQIPYMSEEFADFLEGTYLFFAYQSHLITTTNYSFIYNNQNLQKNQNFIYFRLNLESAGNLLYSLYRLSDAETVDGRYELFNTSFSQYLRGDFDIRYYDVLDESNSLVYRFFAGVAVPFANSTAIPFEKQYFSGGSNGIRAWQVRDLGPGSYRPERRSSYPNQTADIKLEANLEYRFDLFWKLEGALFLDAGNIWAISDEDEREGALFQLNSFHKDIAVGTGIGARLDLSFFIFRLDLGVKMRDPSAEQGNRWLPGNRSYGREDFTLNLGIGYPF